ncbi:MAG: LVIVD repeat-containing protein, partial [Gemmatimonadales bacterium]
MYTRSSIMRGLTGAAAAVLCGVAPLLAQGGPPSIRDPRVGLHTGFTDAGVAAKNMVLIGHQPKADTLDGPGGGRGLTYANSDLAFRGNYVFQGNFSGFAIWDISNPTMPVLASAVFCSTGQGDPSIIGNLLFISSESTGDRTDCSNQGVQDRVSKDRMVGVRIFDVSDIHNPKHVFDVQTCRGSHTHTVVPDPKSKNDVYIWVQGMARVRSPEEMAGCNDWPIDSANSAMYRIDIIRVPLAHPEEAKVVSAGHIFADMVAPKGHGNPPGDTLGGRGGRGGRGGGRGGRALTLANLPPTFVTPLLDSIVKARGGSGAPTSADSAA